MDARLADIRETGQPSAVHKLHSISHDTYAVFVLCAYTEEKELNDAERIDSNRICLVRRNDKQQAPKRTVTVSTDKTNKNYIFLVVD